MNGSECHEMYNVILETLTASLVQELKRQWERVSGGSETFTFAVRSSATPAAAYQQRFASHTAARALRSGAGRRCTCLAASRFAQWQQ